jgi:hypothetical protein
VGDTIRFGHSSRLYVLTGPAELMPQEGLSKQQKQQLKLLEAAQVRASVISVSWMGYLEILRQIQTKPKTLEAA